MMQARRSLAVLLSAAGASVSAGAGLLYLGDDPLKPSPAPQSTAKSLDATDAASDHERPATTGRRRPRRATTKKELGWEQSLARDLACWISSASVYTATQVFYAAAPAAGDLLRVQPPTSAHNKSPRMLSSLSPSSSASSSSSGIYHALLGWMHELDPQAPGWNADQVLQSSSFAMLLGGLAGVGALRQDLELEMVRAVGTLATHTQCAAALAQRATRYGHSALLTLAQHHDQDPRVGRALHALVNDDTALSFGAANLLSLVTLAVADDVPDEYLEFSLWALARAARGETHKWRKTLFGEDAKTRRKLVGNERLWLALASVDASRTLDVQRQAARLLGELTQDTTLAAPRLKKHHGVMGTVVQWIGSRDTALASAALQTVVNVATDKTLRQQLVALEALDVIRARVLDESKRSPELTAYLLRAVRSLAQMPRNDSETYLLDRDALSFVSDDDDEEHPLHHDDLMHPRAAQTHQYVDGWIELFTTFLRSDNDSVRSEAAMCLEQLSTVGTHQDQGIQEWLIAVLDGVLQQVPPSIAASSTSVRAARSRTRPMVGQKAGSDEYAASHAKALRALAFVAGRKECQEELTRRGGVPLLKRLLASSNTEVQRETARVLANLFTCDSMAAEVAEFASNDEQLTKTLDAWTCSTDVMLRSLAHRARSNRRYQHNRLQHADLSDVKYLDNVHPLHFSTSPVFNSGNQDSDNETTNDYDVDVVFIHGLLGCPYETWICGDDESTVWAEKWLLDDLKVDGHNPRLLSIGYDSQLLASDSAWQTMCFQETSQEVLKKLQAARVGDNGRPVVFVTHSLGGVVLKQVLLEATEEAKESAEPSLVNSVNGVVFYGVPHHGSPIAQTIQAFRPRTLGIQQHPVTEHLHGTPHLKMLNDWCASLFDEKAIPAISIGESVPCRIPLIGVDALVVPPASANPGFGEFVCVANADHVDVCKPKSREDERYTLARDFIAKHVSAPQDDDMNVL